jgi:hypothetical protein
MILDFQHEFRIYKKLIFRMKIKIVNIGLLVFGNLVFFTQFPVSVKPGNSSDIKVKVVSIIYGMPHPEDSEAAERGEIVLGGCEFNALSPRWQILVEIPYQASA